MPTVAVLLATHEGAAYLEEQLDSILAQRGVRVRVIASDDASTDATPELLHRASADDRVTVLPPGRFGTPQANFLRLLREADVDGADAVAFADQDDRWHLDKLERQLAQLERLGVDGVSSNVTAFWGPSDAPVRTELVDKAQPQRRLDFLLESGGPGCTFVLRADAAREVRRSLSLVDDDSRVPHDWLVYAILRASGRRWHIDPEPTLDYRQHGANATGANTGLRHAATRVAKLRSGAYRRQCAAVARVALQVADAAHRPMLERAAPLFDRADRRSRARLCALAPQLRRHPREQRLLRLALALGLW
ncbi:glycosyltransferase [Agrococcus sp. TF02-05]|uniref:glycosyltransferase n=1 Tax=Agrococcus sp. TF02-05 TaxID=2815211 RepID=UPI001AA0DD93|nr:glycosyltransferase [Agrococcus sp. TF02-05]